MAVIEEALTSLLTSSSTVNAIISGRVFGGRLPVNATYPNIFFEKILADRIESMEGSSGLCFSRFQLNCYAKTYGGAKDLHEAARLALQGYRGTVAGVIIQGINWTQEIDLFDDDVGVYNVIGEILVHHDEARPS